MNDLCADIGYTSCKKDGEELCGDHIDIVESEYADAGAGSVEQTVAVLSDGLGSGVKACILSTLTAKILSTMMSNGVGIEECSRTVAATLPVCAERKLAYSTFTVACIKNNHDCEMIEYDNPAIILLRDGKNVEFARAQNVIDGKEVFHSKVVLREGDAIIMMSDGAIHAGIGETLNFGWERKDIIAYMEDMYDDGYTAKTLTTILLDKCRELYGGKMKDDTTVCTIKLRRRFPVNLLVGPPSNPDDAERMMSLFFSKSGKHIVCGGTTSKLAAKFLGRELRPGLEYIDPDIPPLGYIDGVDIVSEGILTLNRVLEYTTDYLGANEKYAVWGCRRDAASLIARMLIEEATDINFYVGRAVNPAHQDPSLPISFTVKMNLVEALTDDLKKMGKRIKTSYF